MVRSCVVMSMVPESVMGELEGQEPEKLMVSPEAAWPLHRGAIRSRMLIRNSW